MAIFCGIVCISMHAHYFLFFVVVVVVDLKKKRFGQMVCKELLDNSFAHAEKQNLLGWLKLT